MSAPSAVLLFIGILVSLIGLVWLSQGLGVIPSVSTPHIMNLRPWTYAGGAFAVAGIVLILVSLRTNRRR